MGKRYARGDKAVGECQRCGFKMLRRDMKLDGYYPNLVVCPECWDDRHPLEHLPDIADAINLKRPAPENRLPAETTAELFDVREPVIGLALDLLVNSLQPLVIESVTGSPTGVALTFAEADLTATAEVTDLFYRDGGAAATDNQWQDGDTLSVPLPDYESGDLLILYLSASRAGSEVILAQDPTGWTSLFTSEAGGGFDNRPNIEVWIRIADGTEGSTVDLERTSGGGGGPYTVAQCLSFGNPNTSDPYEVSFTVFAGQEESGRTTISEAATNRQIIRVPEHKFGDEGITVMITAIEQDGDGDAYTFGTTPTEGGASDTIVLDNESPSDQALGASILTRTRLIDHKDGNGETFTNLVEAQRWNQGSAWTTVNTSVGTTGNDYEQAGVWLEDTGGATIQRHGATTTFSVVSGETYYVFLRVGHRFDPNETAANKNIAGLVTWTEDGTEYGRAYTANQLGNGIDEALAVGAALGTGDWDEFYVDPGPGNVTHIFAKRTAAFTGTVTLGFYQGIDNSGLVFERAAGTTSSTEFLENACELTACAVTTDGWVQPHHFDRLYALDGGNLNRGAGIRASDQWLLPRFIIPENELALASTGHITFAMTVRNTTATGQVSAHEMAMHKSGLARWIDDDTLNPWPAAFIMPEGLAEAKPVERLVHPIRPKSSGKWYWEVRTQFNIELAGGSTSQSEDQQIGLMRYDKLEQPGIPFASRLGVWGVICGDPALNGYREDDAFAFTWPVDIFSQGMRSPGWLGFAWDADNGTLDVYQGDNSSFGQITPPAGGWLGASNSTYQVGGLYLPFVLATTNYYRYWFTVSDATRVATSSTEYSIEAAGGSIPTGFTPWAQGEDLF